MEMETVRVPVPEDATLELKRLVLDGNADRLHIEVIPAGQIEFALTGSGPRWGFAIDRAVLFGYEPNRIELPRGRGPLRMGVRIPERLPVQAVLEAGTISTTGTLWDPVLLTGFGDVEVDRLLDGDVGRSRLDTSNGHISVRGTQANLQGSASNGIILWNCQGSANIEAGTSVVVHAAGPEALDIKAEGHITVDGDYDPDKVIARSEIDAVDLM